MGARRRISATEGDAAVRAWLNGARDRGTIAVAVRYSLEEIAARYPGNSVEVRVPPFGVTQCIAGPRHTRGTPPNVVETSAPAWLALATGSDTWPAAVERGELSASGTRTDLGSLLPLFEKLS